jgi:hypothetical protein
VAERLADRPLRGPGRNQWLERLDAETGNLAAAVRWFLDHDRAFTAGSLETGLGRYDKRCCTCARRAI